MVRRGLGRGRPSLPVNTGIELRTFIDIDASIWIFKLRLVVHSGRRGEHEGFRHPRGVNHALLHYWLGEYRKARCRWMCVGRTPNGIDRHDVGMPQCCNRLCLAREALQQHLVHNETAADRLHRQALRAPPRAARRRGHTAGPRAPSFRRPAAPRPPAFRAGSARE